VTELLVRALAVARSVRGSFLQRANSEHGASTVQYALLVALIALGVSILVGALGSGHPGLFGGAHTTMTGFRTVACKVGPALRRSDGSGS
jgi:Flp pilus assembly pilin Flp